MELASSNITQQEKGKMVLAEQEITNITDLNSTSYNKTIEAVVYRKWTSKNTRTKVETKFCCILMDKQGTPIQANMGLRDRDYFDQLLRLRKAYRFSGFSCEPTDPWERTLPNQTTLIFGRFLQAQEVPNADFPEHYFNFAAYNELPGQMAARNPILTDYIGRIRAIDRLITTGDAMSSRTNRRVIDIENLSGNIIGCTLWNEMAINFDVHGYDLMEKPVIIAVSSCYINHYNGMQLSGTSATHYYLNPNIPETNQIRQMFPMLPNTGPMLDIINHRYEDIEAEKTRNRFPLAVLNEIDPQNFQRVRFTTEATIYSINAQRRWYYQKCSECGQKLKQQPPFLTCKDHGPQTGTVYSYCFKVIVDDGSATTSITCFSNQANTFTRDVNQVVEELADKDPYKLPPSLKQLEGTTHIFQFHFDPMLTTRRPDFVLDQVFQNPILALPPPIPTTPPEQDTLPQSPTNLAGPSMTTETTHPSPQHEQQYANITTPEQTFSPQLPQPETYPKPETTKIENPPTKEKPGNQLPKPSVRKTLTYTQTASQPTISETSTPTAGILLHKKTQEDQHKSITTQASKKQKSDP